MMEKPKRDQRDGVDGKRRVYAPPKLERYGSIAEITAFINPGTSDLLGRLTPSSAT